MLWFTNTPTPEMVRRAGQGNEGYGGHWVAELARHVTESGDIELGIATAYPGLHETRFQEDGVHYFVIPQPRRFPAFGMRKVDLRRCVAIIREFKPDLIHIHGSERFYGMVKVLARIPVPMLVSLQGLLGSFSLARHFFGTLSPREILKSVRPLELPARFGLAWQYLDA
ncbi:MAG: glycosyltransferase [Leptospirales bacterium]